MAEKRQVVSFTPDAVAEALAEAELNDAPPPGAVFAMARPRATRAGASADRFDAYRLQVVGSSGVARSSFESCGEMPDDSFEPELQRFSALR